MFAERKWGFFLTIIGNKSQMTLPYGGKKHKQHALQAGILKNCDK
jgi:hypothetical protein